MTHRILLDLDNCMYRRDSGIAKQMGENIRQFGTKTLGLTPEQADITTNQYYKKCGLAVAGYVAECGLSDLTEYLDFVHNNKMEHHKKILKNEQLVEAVENYPHPVFIFTNGTQEHASKCLQALGFPSVFDRIISCYDQWGLFPTKGKPFPPPSEWVNKPAEPAYHTALSFINGTDLPICFADDSYANLKVPKSMGWLTVLVCNDLAPGQRPSVTKSPPDYPNADYLVTDICDVFSLCNQHKN